MSPNPALLQKGLLPDLAIDLPHDDAKVEWWYINGHLKSLDGNEYSFFASFFKNNNDYDRDYYSVMWALYDVKNNIYRSSNILDHQANEIIAQQIKKGEILNENSSFKAALLNGLKQGLPLPDRQSTSAASIAKNNLAITMHGNHFSRDGFGYNLRLVNDVDNIELQLSIIPEKPMCHYGEDGKIFNADGDYMQYHFFPDCRVYGSLTESTSTNVLEGRAWYDHEFGNGLSEHDSWNWFSIRLENNIQIMVYEYLVNKERHSLEAVWVDELGNQQAIHNVELRAKKYWRSVRSMKQYGVEWEISIPEKQALFTITACEYDQEFYCRIPSSPFWEGRLDVKGRLEECPVSGLAMAELGVFDNDKSISTYLSRVSDSVSEALDSCLPNELTDKALANLVMSNHSSTRLLGLDRHAIQKNIFEPIRSLSRRGGKCWRPLIPVLSCQLVGGDPQPFADWLFFPELLHVGSLIIDDVQDESPIRRGGQAIHETYGNATAINTGTLAYFIGEESMYSSSMSDEIKLKCYHMYHSCLKAAHVGQALDINGFYHLLDDEPTTKNINGVIDSVLAAYRLKTGAPASYLGQIGVIVGNGNQQNIDLMGAFMEVVGIAFQIVDDVLNIRGFEQKSKQKGEDIKDGKLTIPILLHLLKSEDKSACLSRFKEAIGASDGELDGLAQLMEQSGSLVESIDMAEEMVENAWVVLDQGTSNSYAKIQLRALVDYLIHRVK